MHSAMTPGCRRSVGPRASGPHQDMSLGEPRKGSGLRERGVRYLPSMMSAMWQLRIGDRQVMSEGPVVPVWPLTQGAMPVRTVCAMALRTHGRRLRSS